MDTKNDKRAAWREANRERIRAYDRARYAERPDTVKARAAAWRKANPDRARAGGARYRAAHREELRAAARARSAAGPTDTRRRLALGFDEAAFEALFARQGRKCAICATEASRRWNLDHCHKSGAARGILCSRCNLGLGLLGDDADVARRAADYVEHHATLQTLL